MLQINQLTIKYDQKIILDKINLNLKGGALHGLVGLNGAGKTTLLNSIYGFAKIYSGEIKLNEAVLNRSLIAFLESSHFFYPYITGLDYLELFAAKNPNYNIQQWNKLMRLPLENLISSYSSGMKKKLALMGIIALDRPIMLLDEPFNTLDLESVEILKKILVTLKNEGKTIIVTSHIIETLTSTCDEIHYLKDGKLIGSFEQSQFIILSNELKEITNSFYEDWVKQTKELH